MELILTRSNAPRKDDRLVIFNIEGRTGSIQFLKTLFDKNAIPSTLTLTGTFAPPKRKETPEERRARLKAITPAQRLAKMEERVARMKAKLAAQAVAPPPPAAKTPANAGAHTRKAKKYLRPLIPC